MTTPDSQNNPAVSANFFRPKNWRKLLLVLLKSGIAIFLLYWLVSSGRLDFSQLRSISWSMRTVGLVLAGVGAVWGGIILLGFRLLLMLKSVGITVPLPRAVSLTAIGLFTGSILPGVVGGDIIKVAYLCQGEASSKRTIATVAVMYDRLVGLFSLFLLGSLVLILAWISDSLPFWTPVFLIAPAVVLLVLVLAGLFANRKYLGSLQPGGWDRNLPIRILKAISVGDHFTRRPVLLSTCVGLALLNHILVCCTFLIAAELLQGVDVPPLQQFLLNPLAMVFNVVPLTPGGVGVTESAFSYLYDAAGCALGGTIGILGRSIQYMAYTAVGFPAFLLRNK